MSDNYASYDYKKVDIKENIEYKYVDALLSLGWEIDNDKTKNDDLYILRRKRKIINKMELLRLEHNLDVCKSEIMKLQKSVFTYAIYASLIVGIIGTIFMGLSTFAVTHNPPQITLCVLFAIPGFILWILPLFIYKLCKKRRDCEIKKFIEEKEDEIDKICVKAMQIIS